MQIGLNVLSAFTKTSLINKPVKQLPQKYLPIRGYFNDEGKIFQWPTKHAKKRLVLEYLVAFFKANRQYTEREVSELLNQHHTFGDAALLRRAMFSGGLLCRTKDCSAYWLP